MRSLPLALSIAWLCLPAAAQGPRLLAPISGAFVGGGRPALRWERTPGSTLEICADRACRRVLTSIAADESATPATSLPPGHAFWRVRAPSGTSAPWELFVGRGPESAVLGRRLDLNGDGYVDVAFSTSSGTLVHSGARSGLARAPSARLPIVATSLDSAADIDGDGFGDLVVLSRYAEPSAQAPFAAAPRAEGDVLFVYRGSASGAAPRPAQTLVVPDTADNAYASLVRGAGDIDGDGYGDVVVANECAPVRSQHMIQGSFVPECGPGAVRVYFGSPTGLSSTRVQSIAGSLGDGAHFGHALGSGADLDADGRADLVVTGGDRALLFLGSAQGLQMHGGARDALAIGELFGAMGDYDGDGRADFLAPRQTEDRVGVRIYHPIPAALTPTSIEVSGPLGFPLRTIGAGDFDGDGRADVIAADLHADAIVLFRNGAAPERVWGPDPARNALELQAAGVGDVDGDGYDDFAFRIVNPAELHIVYGRAASASGARRSTTLGASDDNFYFGWPISALR